MAGLLDMLKLLRSGAAGGGAPLRGRVHRVSIVAGGEVSVVLRFGGEETAARALNQGTLVELRELPAPTSADPSGPR